MKSFLKIILVLSFLISAQTSAATYYVNSLTGNNSNSTLQAQSSSTPWLTLEKAENTATDGDTIRVATGTYVENEATTHGWKVSKGINWIAEGSVTVKATSTATRVLYISGTSLATFTGFTIDAENTRLWAVYLNTGATNKTFDRCSFLNSTANAIISVDSLASNIVIKNSLFQVSTGGVMDSVASSTIINSTINATASTNLIKVTGTGAKNLTISSSTINATTSDRVIYITGTGVNNFTMSSSTVNSSSTNTFFYTSGSGTTNYSIKGNTLHMRGLLNTVLSAQNNGGSLDFQNNIVNLTTNVDGVVIGISSASFSPIIKNNTITLFGGSGIDTGLSPIQLIDQNNVLIEGNTIETMTNKDVGNITMFSTGSTTLNNIIIRSNVLKTRSPGGHVIIIGTETSGAGNNKLDGVQIYDNAIYGALYFNSSLDPNTVINHGIMVGFNKNASIYRNLVHGAGYGIVLKANGDTYSEGFVRDNIFVNNLVGIRIKGVSGVNVVNNINHSSLPLSYTHLYVTDNSGVGPVMSLNAKNNSFTGYSTNPITVESNSVSGLVSDNNCWESGSLGYVVGSSTFSTFATFRNAGYESNGCNQVASFVNASGVYGTSTDFLPLAFSGVIDRGTSVASRTLDLLGNPIYGTPDIGPFEYQPTFTINASTTLFDASAGMRIYGNGKYRLLNNPTGNTSIDLAAVPLDGYVSNSFEEYLTITDITSSPYAKQWTASSSVATSTRFNLRDLIPNTLYVISVDGITSTTSTSLSDGTLSFVYSGGWSTHVFKVSVPETAAPRTTTVTGYGGGSSSSYIVPENVVTTPTIPVIPQIQSSPTFTKSLQSGMTNPEVKTLQQYLNAKGFTVAKIGAGSIGKETNFFGPATKAALIKFQKANKITPAVGFFGPVTRGFILTR